LFVVFLVFVLKGGKGGEIVLGKKKIFFFVGGGGGGGDVANINENFTQNCFSCPVFTVWLF